MVIRVYITGISGSKEIKKRQQRALMILDSLKVRYETVDLSEPGHDDEKEHMKSVCKKRGDQQQAHPPQFFNEDAYCGDYEDFEAASDDDTVLSFLKIEDREDVTIENGEISSGSIEGNDDVNNSIEGDERNQGDGMEGDVIEEDEQVIVEEKMVLKRGGIEQEIEPGMTPEQMIEMIKSGKNQIIEEQQFETQKTENIQQEEPEEESDEGSDEESQESKPKQESQPIESKDEPEDEEMSSEESEE